MAFLLMSSIVFAGSTAESTKCFDMADAAATEIGDMFGLSHAYEHNVFLAVYDTCEAN